ncbi:MAG: hypothetical protein ACXVBE_08245 [Bdellovibrionota bacterium]
METNTSQGHVMKTSSKGTNLETIKLLAQSVIRRLESQKMIAIVREQRAELCDDLANFLAPHVLTQEDMEKNVLGSIGEKNEMLDELRLSGGEAYRTLKQSWLSRYGENEVDGLYFQEPVKYTADRLIQYFMKSKFVEEVFAEDLVLERTIVGTIAGFRRSKLH